MKNRIIVIGGLAAGPAAASKAARTNPQAEIILFEQSEYISYGICELPYFINNKIPFKENLILYSPEKFSAEKNIIVKTNHSVREIIPQKKMILVHDLEKGRLDEYNYDNLILTTGSKSVTHYAFGNHPNVFYLKSLQDALEIKKFIDYQTPKKVTIIGAGFIALEMAESFSSLGMDVTILNIEDLPLKGFEPETGKFALNSLSQNKVRYIKYNSIDGFEYSDQNNIIKIKTDAAEVEQDLILISIGIEPNIDLGKSAKLKTGVRGGYLVDQRMMTSISNIYAAGDCCEIKNSITNKYYYSPFATTALKTGWIAGENAAGGNTILRSSIPAYTVSFFDAEAAHTGLSFNDAISNGFLAEKTSIEGWAQPKIYPGAGKINVTLIYDKRDGRILGADISGKSGAALRANIISTAIYQKLTLKDLLNLDFAYAPQSTPQRDPVLYAAGKGLKSNN
jgi:NADPH-dependent 2,4-dienoyl-CoA reductase/sulfur reductase-like enzyme